MQLLGIHFPEEQVFPLCQSRPSASLSIYFAHLNLLFCLTNAAILYKVHRVNSSLEEEIHFRLLRILDESERVSQREMAREAGVSLGRVNYCLGELAKQGLIKIHRFKSAKHKIPYAYALTPKGLEEKARLTLRFFKRKVAEYEEIKRQIHDLASEVPEERLREVDLSETLVRTIKSP